jgi:hypothetical protein
MKQLLAVLLMVFALSLFMSAPVADAVPVKIHKVHKKHHKHPHHHHHHRHHKQVIIR